MIARCTGPGCFQGRRPCPTPHACHLHAEDERFEDDEFFRQETALHAVFRYCIPFYVFVAFLVWAAVYLFTHWN